MALAATNYPITGVKVASGSAVPLRLNINTLQANGGPMWDLYIRSIIDMRSLDATDQLGYFQVAGIHGRPYIQWNGAGGETSNGWEGYCPHGENLFLTWHRPYVMLWEQRLVETATKLANQYPSAYRSQYLTAAKNLRAPFWDWAASPTVPAATVPTKLSVKAPNGSGLKTISVENPLRYYHFPTKALNQQFGSFSKDPQIYKCRAPSSYPAAANKAMAARSYKSWVYDALTRSTTFNEFASTGSSGISLEQIHNAIHWDGSCGYQFLDADYSGFDPLFMLHHANVDRIWAYWQAMKPSQALFSGSYSGGARYSTPSGTSISTGSPLKPFFSSPGKFHTSNSVKSIKGLGYAYEALEYWKKSDSQMKTDATALINKLYATGAALHHLKKREDVNDNDDGQTTRYFAHIKVNVEELERPCAIGLYANVTSVGNFFVLKQPQTGFYYGQFSLDKAADPVDLRGENSTGVVDDLLSSLRIEIRKHDGTVIPLTDVPSLQIELENVEVVPPPTENHLPVYKGGRRHRAPKKQATGHFTPPGVAYGHKGHGHGHNGGHKEAQGHPYY
ncbi:tyrosinase [Mariannaea sp. PMI_226]|nr:tyrosinase [Mariannaea sp. PMI_226]